MLGGMPHIVTVANGPGRIAFSRDAPGELIVLPLHPGMELDVREHAFLVATHSIQYSFVRIKGLVNLLHGGSGMFMDQFTTQQHPGLLLLHGNGNVLQRTLGPGEKILVEPGAFLYKDSTVRLQAKQMPVKTGFMSHGMYLAEMTGPGRVGIFTASHGPGLLLLHAPGNTFIRDLRRGQSLLVQPSALLYRDATVRVNLHLVYPRNRGFGFWSPRWSYRSTLLRLHGPGRVAVQSVYEPPEDAEVIRAHSYATTRHW
jgi:uncharacterized protein (AIM24 family)